ncbi:PTS system, fructose subfamily, IIA component domain protein, partial [Vibrio parahaemolyticus VP2007-007]
RLKSKPKGRMASSTELPRKTSRKRSL